MGHMQILEDERRRRELALAEFALQQRHSNERGVWKMCVLLMGLILLAKVLGL